MLRMPADIELTVAARSSSSGRASGPDTVELPGRDLGRERGARSRGPQGASSRLIQRGKRVSVRERVSEAGAQLVHPAGASVAYWGRDSRTLYFARANRVYSTTFTPDESGGAPKFGEPKFMYTRASWGALGISPDGKMLGFVDRVREGTPKSLVVRLNGVGVPK